jgi:hypothetical protein
MPKYEEIESKTTVEGEEFEVWSRDSGIHFEVSTFLKPGVAYDEKNPRHVKYHHKFWHFANEADCKAAFTKIKADLQASKDISVSKAIP